MMVGLHTSVVPILWRRLEDGSGPGVGEAQASDDVEE